MTQRLKQIVIACILLFSTGVALAQSYAFTPYQAQYDVYRHGDHIGTAQRTLTRTEQGYQLDFNSDISLFLLYDKRKESCTVTQQDNQLQSLHYQTKINSILEKTQWHVSFDQDAQQIHSSSKPNKVYPLQAPSFDTLCHQLQLKWDIATHQSKFNYHIFDEDEFKNYSYQYLGKEKLETQSGSVEVEKLLLKRGKRETYVWLGIKQDYIPIQIQQFRKGDEVLKMVLKNLALTPK